jgi:LAGLIDADG endonuclease
MFQITKLGDLVFIIDHFKLYPLKTKKYADFLLFKKAFDIINDKKHLIIEGLHELISIRASLNKGLTERLKLAFPSIKPVVRPETPNFSFKPNNSDINYWIAGFVSVPRAAGAEGCFFIHTSKSKTHKLGISVALNFFVVQNIRDSYLLASFAQIFGCGYFNIVEKSGIVSFSVRNLSDITDKIIPFFEEYNIQGVKAKDFNDFKEASILMKSKLHLTKEGLDKILLIKSRMNFNRG